MMSVSARVVAPSTSSSTTKKSSGGQSSYLNPGGLPITVTPSPIVKEIPSIIEPGPGQYGTPIGPQPKSAAPGAPPSTPTPKPKPSGGGGGGGGLPIPGPQSTMQTPTLPADVIGGKPVGPTPLSLQPYNAQSFFTAYPTIAQRMQQGVPFKQALMQEPKYLYGYGKSVAGAGARFTRDLFKIGGAIINYPSNLITYQIGKKGTEPKVVKAADYSEALPYETRGTKTIQYTSGDVDPLGIAPTTEVQDIYMTPGEVLATPFAPSEKVTQVIQKDIDVKLEEALIKYDEKEQPKLQKELDKAVQKVYDNPNFTDAEKEANAQIVVDQFNNEYNYYRNKFADKQYESITKSLSKEYESVISKRQLTELAITGGIGIGTAYLGGYALGAIGTTSRTAGVVSDLIGGGMAVKGGAELVGGIRRGDVGLAEGAVAGIGVVAFGKGFKSGVGTGTYKGVGNYLFGQRIVPEATVKGKAVVSAVELGVSEKGARQVIATVEKGGDTIFTTSRFRESFLGFAPKKAGTGPTRTFTVTSEVLNIKDKQFLAKTKVTGETSSRVNTLLVGGEYAPKGEYVAYRGRAYKVLSETPTTGRIKKYFISESKPFQGISRKGVQGPFELEITRPTGSRTFTAQEGTTSIGFNAQRIVSGGRSISRESALSELFRIGEPSPKAPKRPEVIIEEGAELQLLGLKEEQAISSASIQGSLPFLPSAKPRVPLSKGPQITLTSPQVAEQTSVTSFGIVESRPSRLITPTKQSQSQVSVQDVGEIFGTKQEAPQREKQREITRGASSSSFGISTIQIEQPATSNIFGSRELTGFKQGQLSRQDSISRQTSSQVFGFEGIPTADIGFTTPTPSTSTRVSLDFGEEGGRRERGFLTFVKTSKGYTKVSSKPLPEKSAIALGARITDVSLAKTFKVVPTKSFVKASRQKESAPLFKFRTFQQTRGKKVPLERTFIEKRAFSLEPIEQSQIRGPKVAGIRRAASKRRGGLGIW